MTDSSLLEDTRVVTNPAEPGDHDTFSHYVSKKAWGEALFSGDSVIALCGKVWFPTKDAQRYPVCQACKDAYEALDV